MWTKYPEPPSREEATEIMRRHRSALKQAQEFAERAARAKRGE